MQRLRRAPPRGGVRVLTTPRGPDEGARVIHVDFQGGEKGWRKHQEVEPKSLAALVWNLCRLADEDKIGLQVLHPEREGFQVTLLSDEPIPCALLAKIVRMLAYIPCTCGLPHVVWLARTSEWSAQRACDTWRYTSSFEFGEQNPVGTHACFAYARQGSCTVESAAIAFVISDDTGAHPDRETSGIVLQNDAYVPLMEILSADA